MSLKLQRLASGRTPQGVRGLKYRFHHAAHSKRGSKSHPARGAWIEIGSTGDNAARRGGRTPQGVRGLKSGVEDTGSLEFGRTPQGVRGLKC